MRLALPLAAALAFAPGCTFPEYAVGADAIAGDATIIAVLDPEGVVVEADGGSADTSGTTDATTSDGSTDAAKEATVDTALPPECVVVNRYMRCTISLEWGAARTFCQARGYDLLRINSSIENAVVTNQLTSAAAGSRYYVGLNDVATEGTYLWADGATPTYFNWNLTAGEPSTLTTGNDCVAIRKDGKWQTELCAGPPRPEGFICEVALTMPMDAAL